MAGPKFAHLITMLLGGFAAEEVTAQALAGVTFWENADCSGLVKASILIDVEAGSTSPDGNAYVDGLGGGAKAVNWINPGGYSATGRYLNCSFCSDQDVGTACDVQTGCATGAGCVELMHPNGEYPDVVNVGIATSSLCWAG